MDPHTRDNGADRKLGEVWERKFCRMGLDHGRLLTPHQIGRGGKSAMFYGPKFDGKSGWTLPDITVWSAPGEHHEIKHKNPDYTGCYGLERYRLDALIRFANTTGQKVYYTIHDWDLAGGRDATDNDIAHWVAGDIRELSIGYTRRAEDWTYYNGGMRRMDTWYWTADTSRRYRYFIPLAELWQAEMAHRNEAT